MAFVLLASPVGRPASAQTVSSPPELSFSPPSGFLIPSQEEFVRLTVRSASEVRVRARWIQKDEAYAVWGGASMDDALLAARSGSFGAGHGGNTSHDATAREASDWVLDEIWNPTTLEEATRDFVLSALPSMPIDARGVYLEAESGNGVRASSLLQFVSIGITAHVGTQSSLFWITDLLHGEPLSGVDLTLWDAARIAAHNEGKASSRDTGTDPDPIFRGVSDENGLVWGPGTDVLAPTGRPTAARASIRGRSVWLPLDLPEPTAVLPDSSRVDVDFDATADPDGQPPSGDERAVFFTDRQVYAPEDLLRWQLFSVLRRGSALEWNTDGDWTLHLDGPADPGSPTPFAPPVSTRTYPIRMNQSKEARGTVALPRTVGLYRLRLTPMDDDSIVLERYVQVAAAAVPGLHLTLEDDAADRNARGNLSASGATPGSGEEATNQADPGSSAPLVGRCRISATARVEVAPGRSAGVVPLGWRVETTATDARFAPEFPEFQFHDAWNDALPTAELRRAPETNDDGVASAELSIARGEATSGCRIELRVHPRVLPDGGETRRSWSWYPSTRVPGVRNASRDRESIGALAWEWVVVDLAGSPVEGESVQLELRRVDPGNEALLWTRNGTSSDEPLRLAVERPGPGDYALRVVLPDGTAAMPSPVAPTATAASNTSFLRAASSEGGLDLTLGGTPLAGANTLFVVERGDVLAAKAERIPGDGRLVLPLPPLPPPTATLHVTQVGSDPSRVRFEGGLRQRLPFYRSASAEVASDAPPHRAIVHVEIDAGGQSPDSAFVTIQVETPAGTHPAGRLSISASAIPTNAGAADMATFFGTEPDPLASAFGSAGTAPRWTELRDRLVLSGGVEAASGVATTGIATTGIATEKGADVASGDVTASGDASSADHRGTIASVRHETESGRSARDHESIDAYRHAPAERSLLWSPDVAVPENSGVRFALPLHTIGSDLLRVRVWATTPDVRFGYAEAAVRPDSEILFELDSVPALHAGDQIEWPCRVTNRGTERWEGQLLTELEGGVVRHAPDALRVDPGTTWSGRIEIEAQAEEGALRLTTTLAGADEAVVSSRTASSEVQEPKVERTVVRSGIASPRASDALDLSDGHLLAAQGVEIRVASSYFLELHDPVRVLLDDSVPDPERDIARLAAAALAARTPTWFGTTRDELTRICRECCDRLQAAGIPLGDGVDLPETDLVPASRFRPFSLDARARWAAALAVREGLPVPSSWLKELDVAADSYCVRVRVREIAARPQLEIAALHAWTDRLANRQRPDDSDLVWLLARDTLLGTLGRTYLALAWDAETVRPELVPQLRGQYETLLRDVEEAMDPSRQRVLVEGSIPTSAMLLHLLSERAPNHRLAPTLLRGLLSARNTAGVWPERMNSAYAVCGIGALLNRVESADRPQRAELVLGTSTTKELLLEPGQRIGNEASTNGVAPRNGTPARRDLALAAGSGGQDTGSTRRDEPRPEWKNPIATVTYDLPTLSRMRRHDPDRTELELTLTTDRGSSAYYQILTREESPAAQLSAPTGSIRVTRVFRRVDGTPFATKGADPIGWIDVGRTCLLEVELTIELQESTAGLFVREALPPAATFRGWVQDGASADPGLEQTTVRTDGSIEFVTEPLPAGTHIFRYGLELRNAGRFHLPGTQIEALRTGARGRGAGQELRAER
ncbi:MAG: hypothetical protein H6682_06460 [Candidatus Eisenbacteria bacterium]|nr:hypothetical protein [Candidatus Eisenbacteria bacterium]